MPLMSIPAHFDGTQVLLDEKVALPINARLLVTVLDGSNEDREEFLQLAANSLATAYSDEEVEYTAADLKR
ncbi:MAG: hypothetical protein KGQ87_06835 [Verrucomicrobia bacterium]|nr:hypothetical protein [Verrucomicrobiota bacterium]